jgi:hypothetical protein
MKREKLEIEEDIEYPICDSFRKFEFWTLKNADFVDSKEKNLRLSAFIFIQQM